MEATLFGNIEKKAESRERAKKLAGLYAALRDAPGAVECRKGQITDLKYFIKRSNQRRMDPNDHDGLVRLIGDVEDLLTAADCRAMRRNKKIWRTYKSAGLEGWLGKEPTDKFCTQLHPKEIAYLQSQIDEIGSEIVAINTNVPRIQKQAEALRQVGPFPADIAEHYQLTIDGLPKPKGEPDHETSSE